MANHLIPIFATVALTIDIPEEHLKRGQVGTVVEHLDSEDEEPAELVEFDDADGDVSTMVLVDPQNLVLVAAAT
jgi:uncharacterized protein DUF4926